MDNMFAISFDLNIEILRETFGEPYNPAYDEIKKELNAVGFEWLQGSVYISRDEKDSLAKVYKAISTLSKISWFKESVRDIRAFKVEDWSDFTEIIKS